VMAEAMHLGKPVIATNYSGNTNFTKPENSFLVRYKLRPVGNGCEPYDPGCLWADPDLEDAARHMTSVVTSKPAMRGHFKTGHRPSPRTD